MTLSREEVLHLAELARIELSDEEVERFRTEIQAILGYVERLAAIDTSTVEALSAPADQDGLAKDVVVLFASQDREALIRAFPDRLGQLLRVPGVFEHPKKS
jgi:aspartyl-tRNA(Asn)/glutamyl-tRNA(Gln) amidotransferase subunit C